MIASFKNRNGLALGILIAAKVLGVLGLVVGGFSSRTAGAVLLVFAGIAIVASMVVCVSAMKRHKRQENVQKEMLAQMLREGTLAQMLREVEADAAR